MFENYYAEQKLKAFWKYWVERCHAFDQQMIELDDRSYLTDDEKSSTAKYELDKFNAEMEKLLLTKPN